MDMLNNCRLINIVWIERGIILILIEYFVRNYSKLKDKIIIVEITKYRDLFQLLFPKLRFSRFIKDSKNNFYVNIRRIIKYQDIIIDYLDNYDRVIYGKKIDIVPWYDINDILIIYYFNKEKLLSVEKYKNEYLEFSKCLRGNYNGHIWDLVREKQILTLYTNKINKRFEWNKLFYIINTFFKKNLYDNSLERVFDIPRNHKPLVMSNLEDLEIPIMLPMLPIPIVKKKEVHEVIDVSKDLNEEKLKEILEVFNEKLKLINEILLEN